jgi:hypothetical protein
LLGHLVAVFMVGAEFPHHCSDHDNDAACNGSVGLPVRGLTVPTTGRRPDVLWVPGKSIFASSRALKLQTYGIFPPPPIVKCVVSGVGVWVSDVLMGGSRECRASLGCQASHPKGLRRLFVVEASGPRNFASPGDTRRIQWPAFCCLSFFNSLLPFLPTCD